MFENLFSNNNQAPATPPAGGKKLFEGIFDELVKVQSPEVTPSTIKATTPFKNVPSTTDWTKQTMSIRPLTKKALDTIEATNKAKIKSDWYNSPLGLFTETFAIQNLAKAAKKLFLEEPAQLGAGAVLQGTGGEYTPESGIAKFILGNEPVKELSVQGEETLSGFGVNKEASKKYGGLTGFALLGINFIPGGKDADLLIKELKPFTRMVKTGSEISESVRIGEISKILVKHDLPESFLPAYSEMISKATSKKEIKDIFQGINNALKEYSPAKNVKTAAQIAAEEAKGLSGKAKEEAKPAAADAKTLAKSGEEVSGGGIRELAAEGKAKPANIAKEVEDLKPAGDATGKLKAPAPQPLLSERQTLLLGPGTSKAFQSLASSKNISMIESLYKDVQSLAKSQVANLGMNVKNFNISNEGKAILTKAVEDTKPQIEKLVGKVLTNKEVINTAEITSKVLDKAIGSESTLEWEASLLRARQKLAYASENGVVDQDYIETLKAVKSQGTDIARKLQSFSIGADPKLITSKQAIIEAVMKATDDSAAIVKAAEGVDFSNIKQATEFYRKFVKPSTMDWIDLIRMNSMLTSPLTHIVNIFSNLTNTLTVRPIEKMIAGGFDFLGSKITGKPRSQFASEGVAYARNYFKNIKEATARFTDVMKGQRQYTNLDVSHMPLAASGKSGAVADALSYPLRLLEGMDQFFMSLVSGAEKAALDLREAKGVKVPNIDAAVEARTNYSLFRQKMRTEGEGYVLDAIGGIANLLDAGRKSDNPIISTVFKFSIPFLMTPTNILKQGIEYSPLGFSTVLGAANKTEQLAKATIGTSIAASVAMLWTSSRITWSEPVSEEEKNAFRAAGKQAYSVKIGDKWISYQKLAPAYAFPIALIATVADANKNKKYDDDTLSLVLGSASKYMRFLSDQSYCKSLSNLLSAAQGGESATSQVISNYPLQLIPYRAFGGWINRILDQAQRKVDPEAGSIEKQIQWAIMNFPGLSQFVPARVDSSGKEIKQPLPWINAISPLRMSQEDKEAAAEYEKVISMNDWESQQKEMAKIDRSRVMKIYNQAQGLIASGKKNEAQNIVDDLTEDDYKIYKSIKSTEKAKKTASNKEDVLATYLKVKELLNAGDKASAQRIVDGLTDSQYKAYTLLKNQDKSRSK